MYVLRLKQAFRNALGFVFSAFCGEITLPRFGDWVRRHEELAGGVDSLVEIPDTCEVWSTRLPAGGCPVQTRPRRFGAFAELDEG
jgi:hypothetical protein